MKTRNGLLGVCIAVLSTTVFALPELSPNAPLAPDGAHINPAQSTATHMHIEQTNPKAILNWQSFNIAAPESVHFQQPQNGIALNRIDPGQGVSQIAGRLSATGRIILINPAGIHFTPTSKVDVAGIIATTANITDQNFKNGNYQFQDDSNRSGKILNEGTITINAKEHGFAAFLAPHVENTGTINASLGKIAMYSTTKFVMGFSGNDLIHFHVTPEVVKDVIVKGKMTANQISFTHEHAQQVLDNAIKIADNSIARSVRQENGIIILSAVPESDVVVKDKKGVTYVTTKDRQPGSRAKEPLLVANLNPQPAVVNLASLHFNDDANARRPLAPESDYEMIHSEVKSISSSLSSHASDNDSDFDFSVRSINSEVSSLSSHESDRDSDFDFFDLGVRSISSLDASISSHESESSDADFLTRSLNYEVASDSEEKRNLNYLLNSASRSDSFDLEHTVNLKFRFASQLYYSIEPVGPSAPSPEPGAPMPSALSPEPGAESGYNAHFESENFDLRSVSLDSFSSEESDNSFEMASYSMKTLRLKFRFNSESRFIDEDGLNRVSRSSNLDLERTLHLNFRFASAISDNISEGVIITPEGGSIPQINVITVPTTNVVTINQPGESVIRVPGYNMNFYASPCFENDTDNTGLNSCLQNKTDKAGLITYPDEIEPSDLSQVTVGEVNL